eukprot:3742581-Prymnesium_polylepis.1
MSRFRARLPSPWPWGGGVCAPPQSAPQRADTCNARHTAPTVLCLIILYCYNHRVQSPTRLADGLARAGRAGERVGPASPRRDSRKGALASAKDSTPAKCASRAPRTARASYDTSWYRSGGRCARNCARAADPLRRLRCTCATTTSCGTRSGAGVSHARRSVAGAYALLMPVSPVCWSRSAESTRRT